MSGGRKMKSAVFYGKHDIKVEEVEISFDEANGKNCYGLWNLWY